MVQGSHVLFCNSRLMHQIAFTFIVSPTQLAIGLGDIAVEMVAGRRSLSCTRDESLSGETAYQEAIREPFIKDFPELRTYHLGNTRAPATSADFRYEEVIDISVLRKPSHNPPSMLQKICPRERAEHQVPQTSLASASASTFI